MPVALGVADQPTVRFRPLSWLGGERSDRDPAVLPDAAAVDMADDVKWDIKADEALCRELRLRGPGGKYCDVFRDQLIAHCLPVVVAWLRSGVFFVRSAEIDRPVGEAEEFSFDEIEDLASEILFCAAIRFFDNGIFGNEWTGAGGASLKTYLLNGCIREFANVFRKWKRRKLGWASVLAAPELDHVAESGICDASLYRVDNTDVLRRMLERLHMTERTVLHWHYGLGYTYPEIASFLGLDAETVATISARAMRKARKNELGECSK
ncbi:RNA polymerase sigma factor [Lentzea sp. NPDC054927]